MFGHKSFFNICVIAGWHFYLKIYHKNPICERVLTIS